MKLEPLSFRFHPESAEKLRKMTRDTGQTQVQVLEEAIALLFNTKAAEHNPTKNDYFEVFSDPTTLIIRPKRGGLDGQK